MSEERSIERQKPTIVAPPDLNGVARGGPVPEI